ncbi:MAG: exonuclease domain-containing protein [Pseudomonadota bacterium]
MTDQICVIDTETTGIDETAELVELGAVILEALESGRTPGIVETKTDLVKPSVSIPPSASAIHHITDNMVADAPPACDVFQDYVYDIYVAHNASFDLRFLNHLGGTWICTLKCAYEHWHDAPSYSNQVLSYWLDLPRPPANAGYPHRALYDCCVTAEIFKALIEDGMTLKEMIEVSSRPRLLRTIPFGKHRGTPFAELDPGYLTWMRRQSDWDEDITYTLKKLEEQTQ